MYQDQLSVSCEGLLFRVFQQPLVTSDRTGSVVALTSPYPGAGVTHITGALLDVLERRPDRWWYVRLVPSGQEGWVLSGEGKDLWIECCRMGLNDPKTKSDGARIDRGKLIASLPSGLMPSVSGGITIADQLEDGVAAYQHGDFSTALRIFQPLAE